MKLKRNNAYYLQVRGEMAMKRCEWAHFVVWTEAAQDNLFVEEILFDKCTWDIDIFPKLQSFYVYV